MSYNEDNNVYEKVLFTEQEQKIMDEVRKKTIRIEDMSFEDAIELKTKLDKQREEIKENEAKTLHLGLYFNK